MFFDWFSIEERLFKQSKDIILQFGAEYPDITCSFFAYDTDPIYGYFLLSFDTYENSLQAAQQNEQDTIEHRNKMLSKDWSWRSAKYFSTSPFITDYSPDIGHFAHHMYGEVTFSELEQLSLNDQYPKGQETEDNYIEGNVRIILWRITERLIASNAFSQLRLASPFRLGYQFHDEDLLVLRILNWPQSLQREL